MVAATLAIVFVAVVLYVLLKKPVLSSVNFPDHSIPPFVSIPALIGVAVRSRLQGKGFYEFIREQYGEVIHIRIPFWIDIIFFTSSKLASPLFASKFSDSNETNQAMVRFSMPKALSKDCHDMTPGIANAFNADLYGYYSKMLKTEADLFFERSWNKPVQEINYFIELQDMTINTFLRAFLGPELQGEELKEAANAMKYLDLEDRLTHVNVLLERQFLPSGKVKSDNEYSKVTAMVRKLVDDRIRTKDTRTDFLNYAIKANTKSDDQIDYDEIVKLAFFSVFAAVTNTFATIAWATHYIVSLPEVRKKFDEERHQYLAKLEKGEDLSTDLIRGFPYTSHIILETLRNTMAGLFFRKVTEDIDLGEYVAPKGVYLVLPSTVMIRNPEVWSNPFTFNPDRFLTEGKKGHENLFFGTGRHPCVGTKFAHTQIKTFLFTLFTKYEIKPKHTLAELLPPFQPVGVARPVIPFMVTLKAL